MQPEPFLNYRPDLALGSIVTIAIFVFAMIGVLLLGRRLPSSVQAFVKLSILGIALLVIGKFFLSRTPQPIRVDNPRPVAMTSLPRSTSPSASISPPVVSSDSESAKPDVERPEWTRQPIRIDGVRKLIVVSSGRFASEEEAVLHGMQQAAATTVKEYSSLDPRGIGAVHPQHADMVKDTAIKERYLEVTQHDFGKFKAPMHQLWLQVELSPELGERLAEPWRQAAVDARLRTLTGWSLWSTAVAALAAFSLRLDAAWNGRRRAVIAGTAIALSLGSLAILV